VVVQHIGDLRDQYEGHDEVLLYLNQVRDDVLDNLDAFRPSETENDGVSLSYTHVEDPFRRYQVNVVVDHSQTKGLPVVVEEFPSYANLVGRIEGEVDMGSLNTDCMGIKPGSLHRANGGYLVLRARDILTQPDAWESLKRALNIGFIRIEESALRTGLGVIIPQTIDPEPIPLDLKVVMLGTPGLYYSMYAADEDFSDLFKVKADFASTMERTPETEMDYARFVAARCAEAGLPPFSREAVGRLIEHASRVAEDQSKLTTLFGHVTDLIQEAAYWAMEEGAATITAAHIQRALDEQRYRADLHEERTLEHIQRETIFIDTMGEVVGQVNGLSIVGLGDYAFGQPNRITARVYMGREGVVNIEREVELSGPLHDKGVYTLRGYLGGQYAARVQLALTASITFEQNYGGVEGDSASAAELFALISAISKLPLKQSIAVTGSVNQRGQIQPIGGVNEKIEGFFHVCQARGLTGDQGVVMPCANLPNLMLPTEVVEAVRAGKFHVYGIDRVDQGLELLTGVPAGEQQADGSFPPGTVHHAAQARLNEMSEALRGWLQHEV
jgi:lon-related putative ATP-dependent protease